MTETLPQRPGDALAALRPENVHPADGRATPGVGAGPTRPAPQWPENVIPFVRSRAGDAKRSHIAVATTARPAPVAAPERRARLAAFVVLSLALHAGLYAAFWEEPKPLASVGVEAISIDIVLGGTTDAGVAATPGETEAQPAEPADEVKLQDQALEQQDTASEALPETAVTETRPEEPTVAAVEMPRPETPTALPRETPPAPPRQVQPVAKPKPKPPAQKKEIAPERRQATAPSDAANGIGRGRSDSDSNYHGIVAAHLTRNKQYPPDARLNRDQGTASVAFTLDGSGRVTAAHLVRGSGHASLDQEVQAMVRRASPFPAPPGGRAMSFTVPVSFRLQ
jgi:protein TonB